MTTRKEALERMDMALAADRHAGGKAYWVRSPDDDRRDRELLVRLEALGLIKFDEPTDEVYVKNGVRYTFTNGELKPESTFEKTHYVSAESYVRAGDDTIALIREDHLIETLRAAGYSVERQPLMDEHQAAENALSASCRTIINTRNVHFSSEYQGWLTPKGAAMVIDFLLTKGFRIIRRKPA